MPGVLQIEAMAQPGGLLVLNSVDEPERYSTYLSLIHILSRANSESSSIKYMADNNTILEKLEGLVALSLIHIY